MSESIEALNKKFAIPGVAKIVAGNGGLPRIDISTEAAEAQIYLNGAHVAHYQPRGQRPVLFMSGSSNFTAGKAIRGGVPIVFPWFGARAEDANAPMHGFARLSRWNIESVERRGASAAVVLSLTPSELSRSLWPTDFAMRFTIVIGPQLEMTLEVTNKGSKEFKFEAALHTYLLVGDIRKVRVEGLEDAIYTSRLTGTRTWHEATRQPITFEGETDRLYLHTPHTTKAVDPVLNREITISKEGSMSTVVWNPWINKSKAMPDFGDDEWPDMLCIETANAAENAITLTPGQSHRMQAVISVALVR